MRQQAKTKREETKEVKIMTGRDFTTGSAASAPITFQYYGGRPACFVPKCSTCMYQTCCANAMNQYVPTVTYSTTGVKSCGIDKSPCSVEGNCNDCGKCNK